MYTISVDTVKYCGKIVLLATVDCKNVFDIYLMDHKTMPINLLHILTLNKIDNANNIFLLEFYCLSSFAT